MCHGLCSHPKQQERAANHKEALKKEGSVYSSAEDAYKSLWCASQQALCVWHAALHPRRNLHHLRMASCTLCVCHGTLHSLT